MSLYCSTFSSHCLPQTPGWPECSPDINTGAEVWWHSCRDAHRICISSHISLSPGLEMGGHTSLCFLILQVHRYPSNSTFLSFSAVRCPRPHVQLMTCCPIFALFFSCIPIWFFPVCYISAVVIPAQAWVRCKIPFEVHPAFANLSRALWIPTLCSKMLTASRLGCIFTFHYGPSASSLRLITNT